LQSDKLSDLSACSKQENYWTDLLSFVDVGWRLFYV